MRSPALPSLAFALLLGCGASVSNFTGDVPAVPVDSVVAVDSGVAATDATTVDAPVVRRDVDTSPDARIPVDVAPRTDVPVTPVDSGPGPVCTLRATRWTIDVGGMSATFEFTMDGRWIVTADGTMVASGVYVIEGDRVVLSGEMSGSACAPADRGTFQLRFSPDCEQLQLGLISDDCGDRGDGIDRFRFTRL